MDNQGWVGWILLTAGLMLLVVMNRLELLAVLLPASLLLSVGLVGMMSKKTDVGTSPKKR